MPIDRTLFEELVRRHHATAFQTARRLVRTDADAQDVTQQVFLRVLQGQAKLPQDAADAGPSLRWLAARLALNHLRAARRRRAHEEEYRTMTKPEPNHSPIDGEDELRAVQHALRELPDEVRVPLVLRFQDGMTLAAVADVLGCAESTAHERVRRGLGALRTWLQRLGFAVAAVDLESELATGSAAARVPVGLESALLGLSVPFAVGAGVKIAAGAVFAVALVAGAAWLANGHARDGANLAEPAARVASAVSAPPDSLAPESALETARTVVDRTPVPTTGIDAMAPVPGDRSAHAPARLTGRVIDAESGFAIAGATIEAGSEERRGKLARFAVEATSDRSGAFELELPVAHEGGQAYRVRVVLRDHVPFHSERLVARAGAQMASMRCALRGFAEDVAGPWEIEVVVTDVHGTAVPRAIVKVLRRRRQLGPNEDHPQEAGGRADELGRVVLRGDRLGEKILRVHAFGSEFAPAELDLSIADAGPHRRHVTLAIGATISGSLVAVVDGAPVADTWVEAHAAGDTVAMARTDGAGRFVLRGLPGGAHDLTAQVVEWSPFRRVGVLAGASGVVIRLKRGDDARAHGEYLGEIHGRIVDAVSGEPVPVDPGAVRTLWLRPGAAADPRRLPGQLAPPPVQTMQREVITPAVDGRLVLRRPAPAAEFHEVGLAEGRYVVAVWSPSHAAAFAGPFEVGPGRMATGVEVRLFSGTEVVGTVRDAGGAPVEGASVWVAGTGAEADRLREQVATALRETRGSTAARHDDGARTGADGSFSLPHVPPDYELRVHVAHATAGDAGSQPFVLRPGAREQVIEIVLPGVTDRR